MVSKKLNEAFLPERYELSLSGSECRLVIAGQKLPPPSQRISLHQKGLKIIKAEIVRADKRGPKEYEVIRINHLPTIQQVRLHTKELLYPGRYQIVLNYKLSPDKVKQLSELGDNKPNRELVPSVDEPEAWAVASYIVNWPFL